MINRSSTWWHGWFRVMKHFMKPFRGGRGLIGLPLLGGPQQCCQAATVCGLCSQGWNHWMNWIVPVLKLQSREKNSFPVRISLKSSVPTLGWFVPKHHPVSWNMSGRSKEDRLEIGSPERTAGRSIGLRNQTKSVYIRVYIYIYIDTHAYMMSIYI